MHGDEAERLAGSVLLQAINDAGLRSGIAADLRSVHPLDRAEAVSFLTSPVGEWKKAREFWCGICGRDAEHLRCWAARKLGLPLHPPPSPPQADAPIQLFHPVVRPETRRMTKRSVILNLINRPEGVSPEEIMERCDCSHGTAQVALMQLRHPSVSRPSAARMDVTGSRTSNKALPSFSVGVFALLPDARRIGGVPD